MKGNDIKGGVLLRIIILMCCPSSFAYTLYKQVEAMNSPPYQNNFVNMESAGVFPRVAHRHMYLWIEQQIELKVKAGGPIFSSQVDSLDQFRQEVIVANENNKHFSQLKLQELIDKAAPYSLL